MFITSVKNVQSAEKNLVVIHQYCSLKNGFVQEQSSWVLNPDVQTGFNSCSGHVIYDLDLADHVSAVIIKSHCTSVDTKNSLLITVGTLELRMLNGYTITKKTWLITVGTQVLRMRNMYSSTKNAALIITLSFYEVSNIEYILLFDRKYSEQIQLYSYHENASDFILSRMKNQNFQLGKLSDCFTLLGQSSG